MISPSLSQIILRQLIHWVFAPTLIIFILIGVLFSYSMKKEATREFKTISQGISSTITNEMEDSISIMRFLGKLSNQQDVTEIRQTMASIQQSHPQLLRLSWIDENDKLVVTVPSLYSGRDLPELYFSDDEKHTTISPPRRSSSEEALVVYLTINTAHRGKIIGELSLEHVQKRLNAIALDKEDTEVVVTDYYGNLIVHPNRQLILEQANIGTHPMLSKSKNNEFSSSFFKRDGSYYYGTYQKINNSWLLLVTRPVSSIFGSTFNTLSFGFLILIICYGTLYLIVKIEIRSKVVQPLVLFEKRITNIAQGKYSATFNPSESFLELSGILRESQTMARMINAREEALWEAQEQYRSIFESISEGLFQLNPLGKLISANPALAQLFGFENPDELIVKTPISEQVNNIVEAQMSKIILTQINKGNPIESLEISMQKQDGENILCRISAKPIYDKEGSLIRVDGLLEDITEQRRAEESLRRSEEQLKLALEAGNDGLWDWDIQTGEAYFSPQYYRMLGYEPHDFAANYENWRALVHPQDEQRTTDTIFHAIENRQAFSEEFRMRTKDGAWRWILGRGKVAGIDGTGKPLRVVGTHTDIHRRKMSEVELNRLRNRLTSILDSMPSLLIDLDKDGRILQWNKVAEEKLQKPYQEIAGTHFHTVMPELTEFQEQVRLAGEDGIATGNLQKDMTINGKKRHVNIFIFPVIAEGIDGAMMRIDDISEQHRMEEIMIQTEKMMSVGSLAAGMAHEINNPLGIILQSIQGMQRRITPTLPANKRKAHELDIDLEQMNLYLEARNILKYMNAIEEAGTRAASIVKNMLNFSRKSELQYEKTNLNTILEHAISLASNDYNLKKKYDIRKIEIVKNLDKNLPEISVRATEIEQVLINILRNAAQAFTEKEYVEPESPQITLDTYANEEQVILRISDNGPGMKENVRKRIFEPFYTTKAPGIGTGLGLSVSYFIITQTHNGTLEALSSHGEGTTFIIKLPIATET
ncbi:MAG: PAS domain S-box protein [Desulfovibrio sp.]